MATILVIEDEVDVTEVIKRRLKDAGHMPLIANDPYTGLKLAHEEKPDLILLDLKLPTGGGLSVLKQLKTLPETQGIPVVILTGSRSTEVKDRAIKDGAVAYLEKPYDHNVLLATIKDILEKKSKGGPPTVERY
jgi:DNA-binding response OmpR family regulator